LLSISTETAIS